MCVDVKSLVCLVGVQLFPLHNAVASKNFKHVRDLIDDGHDINEQHYDRVTPLHMACLTGDQHITRFLLERGAWVRPVGNLEG